MMKQMMAVLALAGALLTACNNHESNNQKTAEYE